MAHTNPNLADRVASALKSEAPIRKQFPIVLASEKAIDDESRTVRFVITTGSVDRDNDTIDPMGWDVTNFMRSPSVLWAHDYSHLPVAKAISLTASAQGLESVAQFPPKGMHPFADTVYDLIKFGALNATSVGFRPTSAEAAKDRDGIDFRKQELLEYSIVPVPANPQALIMARSKGVNLAPLEAWAKGILDGTSKANKAVRLKENADGANGEMLCPQCHLGSAYYDGAVCQGCGYCGQPTASVTPSDAKDAMPPDTCSACGGAIADGKCVACGWQSEPMSGQAVRMPARKDNTTSHCPACGTALVDDGDGDGVDHCPGCSWDANPMDDAGVRNTGLDTSMAAFMENGWRVYHRDIDDPVRWNRSLSKAFDVAGEPMEPCKTEVAWVSRYLETPVQDLSVENFYVPSARMGSFLSAYDEGLSAWHVDALRSMTESGREQPPEHESIQLNSTTTRSFMVEGLRFMRRTDGAKLVGKIARSWSGLFVTHYVRHEQAEVRRAFVDVVMTRSTQINFLKGEAFTLSGEFLDRGNLDWPDLFLEPAKEAVLRRTVDRINSLGGDMESCGLMEMGPPGTGKTLSGRVMMHLAKDATFIWVSARDFYRSGSFGTFTYAFDLAAECAPSIIFFEDVDNWISSTEVDLLKTEMDGLKRRKGIQTILTTNFPELIPDALIDRPGRFHDLLELSLPTEAVRARMLRAWLPEAGEAASLKMAADTEGFSGAHLRELVNFARTIQAEETLSADAALGKALAKLREQRELVASLRRGPDYRPGRQVRMAVGQSMQLVAKRGRVLSSANEQRILQAKEHLDAVLDKLNQQPPVTESDGVDEADQKLLLLTDDAPAEARLFLASEDDLDTVVVRIVDERDAMATAEEVRAAVDTALRSVLDGLGPLVREQTTVALARARGRVD